MKKSRLLGALCATIFSFISLPTHAALSYVLGGLAVYDDVADLSWTTNANINGLMTWQDANDWAATLEIGGVGGWYLPDTLQPDASCGTQDGGASYGYTCAGSEMGNLFYNVLGGVAGSNIATTHNSNYDLFSNVQSFFYWSSTEYVPIITYDAWVFNFDDGYQSAPGKDNNHYAWAVQSGNAGEVPVPPALWLFGSGLLGLVGIARRKKI